MGDDGGNADAGDDAGNADAGDDFGGTSDGGGNIDGEDGSGCAAAGTRDLGLGLTGLALFSLMGLGRRRRR